MCGRGSEHVLYMCKHMVSSEKSVPRCLIVRGFSVLFAGRSMTSFSRTRIKLESFALSGRK